MTHTQFQEICRNLLPTPKFCFASFDFLFFSKLADALNSLVERGRVREREREREGERGRERKRGRGGG